MWVSPNNSRCTESHLGKIQLGNNKYIATLPAQDTSVGNTTASQIQPGLHHTYEPSIQHTHPVDALK